MYSKEYYEKYGKKYYKKNKKRIRKQAVRRYKDAPEEKREQKRKQNKIYSKELYIKRKKILDDYKLQKGCAICGYNKCPEALVFHHPNDDKEFNISQFNGKLEKVKEEMEKCDVLCCRCHRELHAKEKAEEVFRKHPVDLALRE